MIGIDARIPLHRWLDDEPARHQRTDAQPAAHGGAPGSSGVTDVVLAEAVWTLKSAFDQDKPAPLSTVRGLWGETAFALEDREAVAAALGLFDACSVGAVIAPTA